MKMNQRKGKRVCCKYGQCVNLVCGCSRRFSQKHSIFNRQEKIYIYKRFAKYFEFFVFNVSRFRC